MRFSLCNEVLSGLSLEQQCEYAAKCGYDGLEIAPYTLFESPDAVTAAEVSRVRAVIEKSGLAVTSLHWLLVKPGGLSVTSPDPEVRALTLKVMPHLVGVCASLGGQVLVHGSARQRVVAQGQSASEAYRFLADAMAQIALDSEREGVLYCIEPLPRQNGSLIGTIAEAARLVGDVAHPNFRTMIDCCAAGTSETETVPELLDRWLPTGLIAHVQINDPNRQAPGQGSMPFADIAAALLRHGYRGAVAVEPFEYVPDGPGSAAFAAGYWRGVCEVAATGVRTRQHLKQVHVDRNASGQRN